MFDRRNVLRALAGLSLFMFTPDGRGQETRNEPRSNVIVTENQKSGSTDWQLTRVRPDNDGYRTPWIEGYCSKQSVAAGESLAIMVSTNPPRRFQIEVFRMGYYGGRGARLLTT